MARKRRVPATTLNRLAYLRNALRQYEEIAIAAEESKSWGPAKDAKKEAVAVRAEIDRLLEQETRSRLPASPEAHRAELLSEVRRLRQQAPAYAADRLIRLENDLITAEAERARQANADSHANRTDEDLEAEAERLRQEREGNGTLRVVK